MHGRETRNGISYGACTRNSEAIIGTRFISTRVFTRIPAVPKHSAFGVSPQIAPCIFANCTRPVIYRGWRAIGTSKNENHASNLSNFHPPKFSTSIDRDADERCPSSQFPFTIRFHSLRLFVSVDDSRGESKNIFSICNFAF